MLGAIQPENAWLIPVAVVAPFLVLGLLCIAEGAWINYKAIMWWLNSRW